VPAEIAGSFSAEQLAAVQRAFGMRYSAGHALDLRRSVALPWGRYYFVMIAGRDRPSSRAGWIASSLIATVAALGSAMLLACAILPPP
jgi:hypothetical protein